MRRFILTAVVFWWLAIPFIAAAQNQLPGFNPEDFFPADEYLTVKVQPEHPEANQPVFLTVEFYLTDLKRAEISWFLNGQLAKKEVGGDSFRFETGDIGSVARVRVVVESFQGKTVQKEIVIRPAEIDLTWNASESYTPPFYQGRAAFSGQGELSFTAWPNFLDQNGRPLNPQSLVYHWYLNGRVLDSHSGFGRRNLRFKERNLFRPPRIKVEAATLDGAIAASREIVVDFARPAVLIYEFHPLLGLLLNRATDRILLKDREVTLLAAPFFFTAPVRDAEFLEYRWTQNQNLIEGPGQKSSVTFRLTDQTAAGAATVGVAVRNFQQPTETARFQTLINIGD